MHWEKYVHLGAGILALGLSFIADANGISLSTDTVWMLRGFASMALGLGTVKAILEKKSLAAGNE